MSKRKKKPKVRDARDLNVPALRNRGGKGAHKNEKKEDNKNKCREPIDD